jgi:ABC-type phosphonate transport system ATPase subunit
MGRSSQSGRGKSCEGEAVAVAVVAPLFRRGVVPGLKTLGSLMLAKALGAQRTELARTHWGLVGTQVCSGIVIVVEVDGRHVAGEPAVNSNGDLV